MNRYGSAELARHTLPLRVTNPFGRRASAGRQWRRALIPLIISVLVVLRQGKAVASSTDSFSWPAESRETRPWAYWWWMGSAVDSTNIVRELTRYRDAGMGGVHIIPIYGAVGWNSQHSPFGPVRMFRSLFDANVDSSTRWRDFENYDLVSTYSRSPLFGSGFGHPFIEEIKLPDITKDYDLEPYIPHNSVLGLWAFGGLVGFALLWAIYPVGMFFTVRAYRSSRTPIERITALGAAAVQICYVMQGYGDLGFGTWGPVFTVATAYALVGKICVANGAWPGRSSRDRVGDPPPVQDLAGIPPPATVPFPRARPGTFEG